MPCIYHDPHFTYTDCAGVEGVVDLQVFYREDNRLVVVASELIPPESAPPAPHVCNNIERIATKVLELGFDFDYLIEHYPVHGRYIGWHREGSQTADIPETFDLVPLQWDAAAKSFRVVPMTDTWPWKHIDRAKAEAIIGEHLEMEYTP